jgi:hypothetical protein
MATSKRKVKSSATKRHYKRLQVTLTRTITITLATELTVEAITSGHAVLTAPDKVRIHNAIRERLAIEQLEGMEREWRTEKVDENQQFAVDWASLQQKEPHIEITEADKPAAVME